MPRLTSIIPNSVATPVFAIKDKSQHGLRQVRRRKESGNVTIKNLDVARPPGLEENKKDKPKQNCL